MPKYTKLFLDSIVTSFPYEVFVIETYTKDGKIVGRAWGQAFKDGVALHRVDVEQDYRKNGLATAMIHELCKACPENYNISGNIE